MGDDDDEPDAGHTDGTSSEEAERLFGVNLRAVREARGMSQVKFAEEMAARGLPWHQQTVTRVETGRRMVRWGEAHAAAAILGVTTDRFTWTTPEAGEREMTAAASARLRGAWRDLALAKARLDDARDVAGRAAKRGATSEFPRVREAAQGIAEDIQDCTAELAFNEADRIRERDRHGEDLWLTSRTVGSRPTAARRSRPRAMAAACAGAPATSTRTALSVTAASPPRSWRKSS